MLSKTAPIATKIAPSTSTCDQIGPDSRCRNCGKNATKKTAVLGLEMPTRKASPNARRECVTGARSREKWPLLRNSLIANQTRYAAPAYLTIEKARTEELITADRPKAVATTITAVAVSMPAIEATASRRLPWPIPREMRNSIAGPGSRMRAVAATANDARVGVDGIPARIAPRNPSQQSRFGGWSDGELAARESGRLLHHVDALPVGGVPLAEDGEPQVE